MTTRGRRIKSSGLFVGALLPTAAALAIVLLRSVVAAVVLSAPLAAESNAEFVAHYSAQDAMQMGEDVRLTLKLRVFNQGEADVLGATLWLEDPAAPASNYGPFGIADLPARESLRLAGTFTVPRHEYESWRQGAKPSVRIRYTDAGGNPVENSVQVVAETIDGEEQ